MSNDIDKKLWRIQEQAMDKVEANDSAGLRKGDLQQLREYQSLYELLEQQPVEQPSPLLTEAVSKQIRKRHCQQRASKLLTFLLCTLMALACVIGFILLLPKSVLLNQLSQSIPLPLLLSSLLAVGIVGWAQRWLIKTNKKA